jgi:hypothetical protein
MHHSEEILYERIEASVFDIFVLEGTLGMILDCEVV